MPNALELVNEELSSDFKSHDQQNTILVINLSVKSGQYYQRKFLNDISISGTYTMSGLEDVLTKYILVE